LSAQSYTFIELSFPWQSSFIALLPQKYVARSAGIIEDRLLLEFEEDITAMKNSPLNDQNWHITCCLEEYYRVWQGLGSTD